MYGLLWGLLLIKSKLLWFEIIQKLWEKASLSSDFRNEGVHCAEICCFLFVFPPFLSFVPPLFSPPFLALFFCLFCWLLEKLATTVSQWHYQGFSNPPFSFMGLYWMSTIWIYHIPLRFLPPNTLWDVDPPNIAICQLFTQSKIGMIF
jgi:hypothetical protein